MSHPALDVLYEDNHLLAVSKPAGLLSQPDATGEASIIDLAADYLRHKYQKPGNVFVGLVHRLDQPVSGVLLLARTSKAASRLSEQFRAGRVRKLYWAEVEGLVPEASGTWIDALLKDPTRNQVAVSDPARDREGTKAARLEYRVLAREGGRTLVELEPHTGRAHQLRVQLSSRGFPIVGDRKYGARSSLRAADGGFRIALHARFLTVEHPTRGEPVTIEAPLPPDWPAGATKPARVE